MLLLQELIKVSFSLDRAVVLFNAKGDVSLSWESYHQNRSQFRRDQGVQGFTSAKGLSPSKQLLDDYKYWISCVRRPSGEHVVVGVYQKVGTQVETNRQGHNHPDAYRFFLEDVEGWAGHPWLGKIVIDLPISEIAQPWVRKLTARDFPIIIE
jgi:hypothetical protein